METRPPPTDNAAIKSTQQEPQGQAPDKKAKGQRAYVKKEVAYPPLSEQPLELLTTNEASFYLRLRPQTLRKQLCHGKCKIKPLKVNGRLLWRKNDLVNLLLQP